MKKDFNIGYNILYREYMPREFANTHFNFDLKKHQIYITVLLVEEPIFLEMRELIENLNNLIYDV